MRKGVNVFKKPREVIGKPWTYTEETKERLRAEKETESDRVAIQKAILSSLEKQEPTFTPTIYPRTRRTLQANNGRRVSKTTAKVNSEGGRYTTHKPVMSEDLFKKLRELGYKAKDLRNDTNQQ